MEIYAIVDGNVLPYILDPNFEKYLPIIPSEVRLINIIIYYVHTSLELTKERSRLQTPKVEV